MLTQGKTENRRRGIIDSDDEEDKRAKAEEISSNEDATDEQAEGIPDLDDDDEDLIDDEDDGEDARRKVERNLPGELASISDLVRSTELTCCTCSRIQLTREAATRGAFQALCKHDFGYLFGNPAEQHPRSHTWSTFTFFQKARPFYEIQNGFSVLELLRTRSLELSIRLLHLQFGKRNSGKPWTRNPTCPWCQSIIRQGVMDVIATEQQVSWPLFR
jgi:hypothetical protein